MSGPERRWLKISETAELLGLSVKGAYEMAAAGKIPAVRLGRTVRVDRKALEAQLEAQISGAAKAR
jgi:excisionase family DNA binding protein